MPPNPLYRFEAPKESGAPEALVLHCSDHRFQYAFNRFLTESLKLGSYALLSFPGGGHFVSLESILPKFAKIGLENMRFHIKRARPRKLILIGHDDCLFFKERAQFLFFEADLRSKQFANLRKARHFLREQFPELPIEVYFATLQPDSSIQIIGVE